MAETHEQQAFINYCDWKGYREKYVIAAVPNQRKVNIATGLRFKREGVLAGMPDVFVAVPRGNVPGLWFEFKFGKNKCSPEQLRVHKLLRSAGYTVVVVWSSEEAINALERYLNG